MLSSVKSFLWKNDMNYEENDDLIPSFQQQQQRGQDYNTTIALVAERAGTTQNVVLSGSSDPNQNSSSTGYNVVTTTGPYIPIPPRQQQQTPHNTTPNTGGTTETPNNDNNTTTTTAATNSVITSSAPNSANSTPVLTNITTSISVGSTFLNWEQVDEVLEMYGREKGFVVRKKRVERDDMGMVRKRTYDCEHGGRYTPKKKAAIHEQRNRTSKRIECGWHINLSFPKTSSHITVTTFVNEHNHELNPHHHPHYHPHHSSSREKRQSSSSSSHHSHQQSPSSSSPSPTATISNPSLGIQSPSPQQQSPPQSTLPRYHRNVLEVASPKNRNLPKAVLEDIEFYTIHGNLGVTTQRQLLKAKYPNHQLPARDISNAVQKFKGVIDLKSLDNDAPKLWIWELARKATQIALDQQDNTLEELLKSYIREKEDRVGTTNNNLNLISSNNLSSVINMSGISNASNVNSNIGGNLNTNNSSVNRQNPQATQQ